MACLTRDKSIISSMCDGVGYLNSAAFICGMYFGINPWFVGLGMLSVLCLVPMFYHILEATNEKNIL